jgi:hypothetical protein
MRVWKELDTGSTVVPTPRLSPTRFGRSQGRIPWKFTVQRRSNPVWDTTPYRLLGAGSIPAATDILAAMPG